MLHWEGRGLGGAALVALAFTLLAGTARAELTPAQKALSEQGRYWEDRHRADRATVAWEKLLESDPDNAEALLHLGIIEARAGHPDRARSYAARLHAAHPDSAENTVLGRAIALGTIPATAVDEARRLAGAGQYEAAIAAYKKALNNQPPPPDLAQEYYQTLAGTKNGWDEARRSLQELVTALPNDPSIAYAYARVLTYREETRRQGLAMMAQLSGEPAIARQATQGWHDALIWLGARRDDIPLYQTYLASHANDVQVAKKLEALQNPSLAAQYGADEGHRQAFAELDEGHLSQAEALFAAILRTNPNDADALGGMGVVRERQGKQREAQEYLQRAVQMQKEPETRWNAALASVMYLGAVADARAALRARNFALAEERARFALQHPLEGNFEAELILAQLYRDTKRWREAEEIYRRVLAAKPGDREAAAGLTAVLVATGRAVEARKFAAEVPGEIRSLERAESDRLAAQARAQVNAGNTQAALASFKAAVERFPGSPWLRLDYARLLERVGDRSGADREILAMVGTNPGGEAYAAAAIWYGEHGQYDEAASYATHVPPGQRNTEFVSLERQWRASVEAKRAVQLAHSGHATEANKILEGIVAGANGNVGIIGVAADAYVDINEPQNAIAAMRAIATNNPSLDLQLQYAGVLLRVNSLEEMTAVMNGIDRQSASLNPAQQGRVADLHRALAIKLADEARLHGDFAGAYDRLAPELAISRDPTTLAALARIYQSAGRDGDALDVYNRIIRAEPTNMDARREIISAAIAVGDYDRAQRLLIVAMKQSPNDPRVHLLAAELARAVGDDDTAVAELTVAQRQLVRQYGPVAQNEPGLYQAVPRDEYGNPFVQRGPEQPVAAQAPPTYYTTTYSVYQVAPTYGTNPAYPVPQITGQVRAGPPATDDQVLQQQVAVELEQIRDADRPFIEGAFGFRSVDGEPGLSQLNVISVPITGGARLGPGTLSLRVEPTDASSGTLNNTDPSVFRRFGTDPVLGKKVTTAMSYDGSAQGVGLSVGYSLQDLAGELGVTPLGFPTTNVVGHLVWAIPLDNQTSIKLTGLREQVNDSLLAYAGTKDPLSGITWGGVVKSGGRFDFGHDNGVFGYYADATGAFLDGTHTASNFMFDGGGGAYWRFWRTQNGAFKIGVNLQGQAYEKNLDFYTLGQGGYFSPQAAVEATIPIEYSGRWGRLSYSLGGQLGVMNFHEDGSPYFPLDPGLQTLALKNSKINTYPGETITTAIYGVAAKAEYEVAPLLVVGGALSADNSHNYNEQSLLLYIRKKFDTY